MKNKKPLGFWSLTVLLVLCVASVNFRTAQGAGTKIFVYDPEWEGNISTAEINATFTIEIKISDVTELIAYQFFLQWNTSILDVVEVAEGPFLNHSGSYPSDFGPVRKPGDAGWDYSDTLYAIDTLINPTREMSATGSGTLVTVTFRVKAEGISTLHFRQKDAEFPFESKLLAWVPPGGTVPGGIPKIPHTTEDGYFILPGPKIFVDPKEVLRPDYLAGASFDINISVTTVNNLYNWSLGLRWDPAVLYATDVVEGPFLMNAAPPGEPPEFKKTINPTAGFLNMSNRLKGEPLGGVNGSGTLATVTFLVEGKGECELKIYDTKLYKSDIFAPDKRFILHVHKSGYFSNVNHDVAITNVDVAPTSVRVGETVNITITAENVGEIEEDFDVTAYYDNKTIGSTSVVNLPPGNSTTKTINWVTTNVVPGTYTIKAKASPVHGEVNLDNNVKEAASKVTVSSGQFDIMMPLLIGGVAVVATGGITGFFLHRRRSKSRNKS